MQQLILCYYRLFRSGFEIVQESEDSNKLSYAALLAVQIAFGTFPAIGKIVLGVIPSFALVGIRIGIAALIFYIFQRSRGTMRLAEKRDYFLMAGFGMLGVALNQLLFVHGLSLTKAINASLIAVTIPIFTLIVGAIIGTEKLGLAKIGGIALAALGVISLIDPRRASFSTDTTMGDILVVLNSLSYGIYVATSKNAVTRNGAMRSITWIFIFASLFCVPLGAYSLSSTDIPAVDPTIWLMALHIAVASTAVPYFLNAWALARVDPSTVAVFVYLQPVIGFLTAVVFLGEHIGVNFILAAALIFAGVFLVTKKRVSA